MPKTNPRESAMWSQDVPNVQHLVFTTPDGVTWTITGHEYGDNVTGAWFVDAVNPAGEKCGFAIRDAALQGIASTLIRASMKVARETIRQMPHYVAPRRPDLRDVVCRCPETETACPHWTTTRVRS